MCAKYFLITVELNGTETDQAVTTQTIFALRINFLLVLVSLGDLLIKIKRLE